jgi:hypothetical protein
MKTFKLIYTKKNKQKNGDVIYAKCQICGENAVGLACSNRYMNYQCYPVNNDGTDISDKIFTVDDIKIFDTCDYCCEHFNIDADDIFIYKNKKYKIELSFRGNE